ncbi:hypothetical protein [Deinococcus radiophilus]|uniref:Uncharacterized protein n=1 Tax=Deinococcus radiophilus TaxID=32062 RepID=A0A3S0ISX4_9DEIO|nr:hypothetical protein [Deinococcus radiophilus]RTR30730.1 hypothetical protein EJ104_00275 [Deinococcus radiophilus]UFA51284.1 hypothetical protein LMT64_05145 [Deinococcus radiophilus]
MTAEIRRTIEKLERLLHHSEVSLDDLEDALEPLYSLSAQKFFESNQRPTLLSLAEYEEELGHAASLCRASQEIRHTLTDAAYLQTERRNGGEHLSRLLS